MCGIFVYHTQAVSSKRSTEALVAAAKKLQHRGPDNFAYEWVSNECFFAFHRLSLVGLDQTSNQPLHAKNCTLICNGMIYNYADLIARHNLGADLITKNDCEVVIHLYRMFGMEAAVKMLDGSVFALALYDHENSTLIIANDHIGVRPLYSGGTTTLEMFFASEPCALAGLVDKICWFQPGTVATFNTSGVTRHLYWWNVPRLPPKPLDDAEEAALGISHYLNCAVQKRMLGERKVGCLLSGGLDSSTVAALVAQRLPGVRTFCIGLAGSPDMKCAKIVAEHIKSTHTAVEVTVAEMLAAIPEVVAAIQSYDVTTVRASVPQYLLCKYIAKNHPDIKILFNGDCSEEIFASYAYSKFAPTAGEFFLDNQRLVREVHLYDVLRSDRCIAHFGIDARTPFADRELLEFVMTIAPELKMFGPRARFGIEKHLLRTVSQNVLPREIAWRAKTAFSDGVSAENNSWHTILQHHFSTREIPAPFLEHSEIKTAEAYEYLKLYAEIFGQAPLDVLMRKNPFCNSLADLVPQYWMPRFVPGMTDPSARELPAVE